MYLEQGDQFEVREDKGKVVLVPVSVYHGHIIKDLKAQVNELKESIKNGDVPVFDSIDSFF
ncbi:MAG: AbrB/MazE/SpoVT family DNA-binding domain-containing protein [Finegoldia sp.]|nr:AbrB/MazE/SpoVT family DNA-binding domain-containing protein [Finegoldia sp.]